MASVTLDFVKDGQTDFIPVAGKITATPTTIRHHAASTIVPAAQTVEIVNGKAIINLDKTGRRWAWKITIKIFGAKEWTDYVLIPNHEPVNYKDLPKIHPDTLTPINAPEPYWYAMVAELEARKPKDGKDGKDGERGKDGEPGIGIDGKPGKPGKDGTTIADTDPRLLRTVHSPDFPVPFSDKDGYVSGGIKRDGSLELFKAPTVPHNSFTPDNTRGMVSLDPSTGYTSGIFDKDGYLSFAVTLDGRVKVFKGDGGVASKTKIVCAGDSLTRGYTGSTAWDIIDSWPTKLGEKLPGVSVANLGFGGNTVDEILVRMGAKELWLTIAGGTIPATGPVTVNTKQKIGFVPAGNISFVGFLAGIYGTFSRNSTTMQFTRAAAGTPVTVTEPQLFKVNQPDYSGHTLILWTGRNDVSYNVLGAENTTAEHVIASTMEAVEWLTPRIKQVIVVGTTNRVDEPRGTAKYDTVIEINNSLKTLLPGRYINIREWLVNTAIYMTGMTPTSADLQAIANDTPPPQIMDGGSHYNKPIAPLLADIFYDKVLSKGYVK